VIFGYKRLSGFWTGSFSRRNPELILISSSSPAITQPTLDPHDKKVRRLQTAVLTGPGALDPSLRQAISEGQEVSGVLGAYVNKVAEHAHLITDEDIADLHQAGYTDDQIFEATVSAALGAGILRLECVLRAFGSDQSTNVEPAELPLEAISPPSISTNVARV